MSDTNSKRQQETEKKKKNQKTDIHLLLATETDGAFTQNKDCPLAHKAARSTTSPKKSQLETSRT